MLCSATRKNVVAETLGCGLIEYSVLLEHAESVCIQHFGPLIAVISCGIPARHDVRKLGSHARFGQLFHDDGLFPRLFLKGNDVCRECLSLCIVGHIEQSKAHLSHTSRCRHEVSAFHNAVDKLVGDGFACFVVEGKSS